MWNCGSIYQETKDSTKVLLFRDQLHIVQNVNCMYMIYQCVKRLKRSARNPNAKESEGATKKPDLPEALEEMEVTYKKSKKYNKRINKKASIGDKAANKGGDNSQEEPVDGEAVTQNKSLSDYPTQVIVRRSLYIV